MPLVLELVASRAVESSGNGGDGVVITSLVSDVALPSMCITTNLLLHLFCIHRFRDICFPIFQTLILSWYHQATFKKFVFAGATSCFNFNLILFRCRMLFTKNQSRHYYFLINHAFDLVLNPGGLFFGVGSVYSKRKI